MDTKTKRKSRAIGIIPFMDDYRVLVNLQYEAKMRGIRVDAYIVDILEDKLSKDTGNMSFKVMSGQQLHRTIREVCKGSVSNYIEKACADAINVATTAQPTATIMQPSATTVQPDDGAPAQFIDKGKTIDLPWFSKKQ